MSLIIALIPAIPFIGFLILSLGSMRLSRKAAGIIGTVSVGISALLTFIAAAIFFRGLPEVKVYSSNVWDWINVGGLRAGISFSLDSLSLVFCFIVTFVGFLIHLYSVEFMKEDEGLIRFFAYMNLFVGSMLVLVMADNLLFLYLGWEGVGLCSYLLIGFWYKDPANDYAGRKAFIMTRIGDTAMIIGIILLFVTFGTLNINELMARAPGHWLPGSPIAVITAALLLTGALSKSAQLPLQTWLPDAMAGPSPVSALIHAATMVTAGVYLIARTNVIFTLAPVILHLVAVIGALTLLLAGFSALTQHDLKRILAYSTISQIGYMFLALGVGAYSSAVFHFVVHAFFKALLFLAGGIVIQILNEEHNIFKMGGLRKKIPIVFITFLAGSASLSALPLITAGFYSKDEILWYSLSSSTGSTLLWLAGIVGALLTALYSFRMVFIAFFGEAKTEPAFYPGKTMIVPITVLAILSVIGGFVELPGSMGNFHPFSVFVGNTLPTAVIAEGGYSEAIMEVVSGIVVLTGIWLAWVFYMRRPYIGEVFEHSALSRFLEKGWGFDALYNVLVVRPVVWLSEIDRKDFLDWLGIGLSKLTLLLNRLLSITQNGSLRWYLMLLAVGVALILTYILPK
ncbi:MAG: NADH-quinone oxidoreductase subunit L [Bacteroidales bacterium]